VAKTPAVDVNAVVTEALLKVAAADTPPRMVVKDDPAALFTSKTKENKKPYEALTGDPPLVVVTGKGAAEAVFLTPAGFERVRESLPAEQVGPVLRRVAARLPVDERLEYLQGLLGRTPDPIPEVLQELEAATAADRARREEEDRAGERERTRDEALKAAAARVVELVDQRKRERIASLLGRLRAEGWTEPTGLTGLGVPPPPPPPPPERRDRPAPQTREDADFRRDLAERLVSSWRDAEQLRKDEARPFLETAMDNLVGLKRVGEEGDEVPFDGAVHEAVPGVFTDHPVRVTRSGWALEEDADREYVIQKAQVAKL